MAAAGPVSRPPVANWVRPRGRDPVIRQEAELRAPLTSGLAGSAVDYRRFLERLGPHLRAHYKGKFTAADGRPRKPRTLVQKTLMVVHTRRHACDRAQPVTPGVYAIARNKLIDHRRRTRAKLANVLVEDAGELVGVTITRQLRARSTSSGCSRGWPAKVRQALRFMKVEGLSAAEAAERSGMSESAIKVSVHCGLKAMATFTGAKRK